ncbi:SDR family NAD(P)-dependent oxidoreductase [Siccirubricoccus phaeus]|uniref:SDR family NAD(P)-dependent oxidoreductase n=1 Tax=Siccirubricoccus phaeus TaxID=2595053 RepID=UPI0011F1C659|nr:SDR family oxidoreductase [Siccirubricoccus phaeus]
MDPAQRVLVTGVATGIGRAIAERLTADGYAVLGLDIDAAVPDGLAGFAQADVTDPAATRAALARLLEGGPITRLVNNVGSSRREYIADATAETQRWLVRLNLGSAMLCVQAVLPGMRAAGFGRIVNITSRAVFGRETRSAYAATKAALAALTRSWAREFAAAGITCNAVGPGMINTDLFRRNNPADAPDVTRLTGGVPMRRIGEPAEIAQAVAHFLEARSSYVTGQMLFVCGGLSLGPLEPGRNAELEAADRLG